MATLFAFTSVAMADLKSEITTYNKKMEQVFLKNDFKTFAKLTKEVCTKDFKYIEGGKSMNYDQMLAMMKGSFSGGMGKVTKAETKVVSAKEKGNTGTSKVIYTMVMTSKEGGKTHVTKMVGNVENTYRKEGGKWKTSIMDWKDTKMTVDGKPMDMSKMGGG